jgi:hypothetical protein
MLLLSPYLHATYCSVIGRNRDNTTVFRNRKEPGALSLCTGTCKGVGVYDCNTYGARGQTFWFLPVNSLFPTHKTSKTAGSGQLFLLDGCDEKSMRWGRQISGDKAELLTSCWQKNTANYIHYLSVLNTHKKSTTHWKIFKNPQRLSPLS